MVATFISSTMNDIREFQTTPENLNANIDLVTREETLACPSVQKALSLASSTIFMLHSMRWQSMIKLSSSLHQIFVTEFLLMPEMLQLLDAQLHTRALISFSTING